MKYKKIAALLCSVALLLSGCGAPPEKEPLSYTDTLFDTTISVQIFDPVEETVMDGCKKLCNRYDELFSKNNKNSDIYKINHADGASVEVSEDTIALIKKGLDYCEISEGLFDISIGSLTNLWDFKSDTPFIPKQEEILNGIAHTNYKNIIIEGRTVCLTDSSASIDVGGIAKGFIADCIKDYLKENGVKHAMINLGGNVLTLGTKTDGSKFNIGIQKPFDNTGVPLTSVKVADQSVVTAGIYQRYFELNGKIYHHILDPNTGYPCENNLYSVTIITDSSAAADALSTLCFLMGYERGMKFVNQLEHVDALFITNDYQIHYSDNFPE